MVDLQNRMQNGPLSLMTPHVGAALTTMASVHV